MNKAILAKKVGMTQVFNEDGQAIPVTVLEAGPCAVIFKRTAERDGYEALQVGFQPKKEKRANKPEKGHLARTGAGPFKYVKEFRVANIDDYDEGQEIRADIFKEGDRVDIRGISKGKGFSGGVKRHGFGTGPKTHGSRFHRKPGTLGGMDPGHVFKGRLLPGRMGGNKVMVQNLEIIKVDPDKNLLLVKGSVPGNRGSVLMIKNSVKAG